MENTIRLQKKFGRGSLVGFGNLFQVSNASWWHTKKWLIHTVLWFVVLGGIFSAGVWAVPIETVTEFTGAQSSLSLGIILQNKFGMALMNFFLYAGLALPIAAIITGQDAIIGERLTGTGAWLLSKPLSRAAFILSKLAASTIGLVVTGIVIQGVLAYAQLSLRIGSPWSMGFFSAMGMVFLNLFFYLTLTFMLGSLFTNRGIVLGISMGLALAGPLALHSLPIIKDITPWNFFMPMDNVIPPCIPLALGQPVESVIPIIGTALMCLVFIAVTLWRFQREEF